MNTENNTPDPSGPQSEAADHDTSDHAGGPERSLRFWLRAADHALASERARILADEGLDRRDWMVLNVIAGSVEIPGIADRIRRGGKRVRALAARGWVAETEGQWRITELGSAERERIDGLVAGVRERVDGAVSAADLATTVSTLEAIARAAGWDESTGRAFGPRGGRGFGPGRRHGFGPGAGFGGFGPGAGFGGPRGGFEPRGHGHGHDEHEHGNGHGEHGHREHGRPEHGHRGCGPHARPGGDHSHRRGERAFERGFTAGFRAGRDAA